MPRDCDLTLLKRLTTSTRYIGGRIMRRLRRRFWSEEERRHALVGRPHSWRIKRQFQIDFLKAAGLTPSDYLLDVGCGTLRGGIPLIAYLERGHYWGVECRSKVLAEGWKELAGHKLEWKAPVLVVSQSLSSLSLGSTFDVVWGFSLLSHVEDSTVEECFGFMARHLKSDGVAYANVWMGPRTSSADWRRSSGVPRPLEFYQTTSARTGLCVADLGTLKAVGHPMGDGSWQRMLKFWLA